LETKHKGNKQTDTDKYTHNTHTHSNMTVSYAHFLSSWKTRPKQTKVT